MEAGTHADTLMIASIDNKSKEIKIVFIYRDLIVKRPDGELVKANSTYFLGRPKQAISMLNQNFDYPCGNRKKVLLLECAYVFLSNT